MKKINQSSMTQKEFIEFCQDKDKTYLATQLYQWKRRAVINERKLYKAKEGFDLPNSSFRADPGFRKFYDESNTPYSPYYMYHYILHAFGDAGGISPGLFNQIVRSWIGGRDLYKAIKTAENMSVDYTGLTEEEVQELDDAIEQIFAAARFLSGGVEDE